MDRSPNLKDYKHYLNGAWSKAAGETFESFSPYTGQAWTRSARGDARDDLLAQMAPDAFPEEVDFGSAIGGEVC